jgi:transcription-repair coupling factor (superfamily II helicase)
LGKKQSGHITALGFEFYLQMIENAVRQLKGEVAEEEIDPTLNLKVSAFLSEEYIPDTHQRLSIYKRLSSIRNEGELETMEEELRDRFGPLPPPAQQLLRVMEIKIFCKQFRLLRIDSREEGPLFTLDRSHHIPQEGLDTFMTLYHGKIRFHSEYSFQLLIRTDTWDDEYVVIRNCLQALKTTQYNPLQRSIS